MRNADIVLGIHCCRGRVDSRWSTSTVIDGFVQGNDLDKFVEDVLRPIDAGCRPKGHPSYHRTV